MWNHWGQFFTVPHGRNIIRLRRQERLEDAIKRSDSNPGRSLGVWEPRRPHFAWKAIQIMPLPSSFNQPSHLYPSILNISHPDSCPLCGRQSVTVVRGRCVTFGDGSVWKTPYSGACKPGMKSLGMRDPTSKLCLGGNTKQIPHPSSLINHQSSTLHRLFLLLC